MGLLIHVDGGARGNPGPAGAGVVIETEDGLILHEGAYFLGNMTNNAAEYHALLRALKRAERCAGQPLSIRSDSELLVRQLTGEYRVKSPKLRELYERAQLLLLRVAVWNIKHIDREDNQRADELANLAMDRRRDVIVTDVDGEVADSDDSPTATSDESASPTADGDAPSPIASVDDSPRPVHVRAVESPKDGECPAAAWCDGAIVVGSRLPSGMCVHAAHALVHTILAVQNTAAAEFSSVPTMTVRCSRPGCSATFHVSPHRSGNGKSSHAD